MEDLPLGRIAALVPEFAVKDLPLGRKLMMMKDNSLQLNILHIPCKKTVFKLTDNTRQMLFFLIVISLHHLPLLTPQTHIHTYTHTHTHAHTHGGPFYKSCFSTKMQKQD